MNSQIFSAAAEVDRAFLIILGFSVFILILITVLMVFFLWRYNHKRHPVPSGSEGSVFLEIMWTALPTVIVLGLFWTGWTSFKAMRNIPDDALAVEVEGRMWSWKFTYPGGRTDPDLIVPVDTPVRLIMTTRDVIHSFYIPALRLKWDTVPGMTTEAWFESSQTGEFDIFCAEYCGLKHADMMSMLKVLSQEEYEAWVKAPEKRKVGLAVLKEYGCIDCHSLDGSEELGPTFRGLGGSNRLVVLPDGSEKEVVADSDYLRRAILAPSDEIVKDWDDMMISYEGDVSEEDLNAMVTYLLSETAEGGEQEPSEGDKLAMEQGCVDCHSIDGTEEVGPSLLDIYGRKQLVNREGMIVEVVVDEEYLLRSMVSPDRDIPEGYESGMPGYDDLDEESLALLVDWMKSIRSMGESAAISGEEGG